MGVGGWGAVGSPLRRAGVAQEASANRAPDPGLSRIPSPGAPLRGGAGTGEGQASAGRPVFFAETGYFCSLYFGTHGAAAPTICFLTSDPCASNRIRSSPAPTPPCGLRGAGSSRMGFRPKGTRLRSYYLKYPSPPAKSLRRQSLVLPPPPRGEGEPALAVCRLPPQPFS